MTEIQRLWLLFESYCPGSKDPWVIDSPKKAEFFVLHGYEKIQEMRDNPLT